jgi:hypothetical protein
MLVLKYYTLWAGIILMKIISYKIINDTVNLTVMSVYAYEIKINLNTYMWFWMHETVKTWLIFQSDCCHWCFLCLFIPCSCFCNNFIQITPAFVTLMSFYHDHWQTCFGQKYTIFIVCFYQFIFIWFKIVYICLLFTKSSSKVPVWYFI